MQKLYEICRNPVAELLHNSKHDKDSSPQMGLEKILMLDQEEREQLRELLQTHVQRTRARFDLDRANRKKSEAYNNARTRLNEFLLKERMLGSRSQDVERRSSPPLTLARAATA
jgi:hypothetical protein